MKKAHSFWLIIHGQIATSFRARQREDLLPTFNQLRRTQPDVRLVWFERGRVWSGPREAREALLARRRAPVSRPREWRPGGSHRDPRARFEMTRDEKRARFKSLSRRRRMGPPPGRRKNGK